MAAGNTNLQIACKPLVSEAAVKTHLLNIYAKLEVNDHAAGVAVGYKKSLLGNDTKP